MKSGATLLLTAFSLAFLALPTAVRADANPDFDDDAKPILRSQPGLLHYVESRFEVKDTGTAKYPGDDDRRPAPPYIFHARPLGSHGPFSLLLLIQPGPPGHILGVVDGTKVHVRSPGAPPAAPEPPAVAQRPSSPSTFQPGPPTYQSPSLSQAPATTAPPASSTPAPAPSSGQPSEPTADTPSGPITDPGQLNTPSSSSSQPNLAPPPDPAPSSQ